MKIRVVKTASNAKAVQAVSYQNNKRMEKIRRRKKLHLCEPLYAGIVEHKF